MGKKKDKEMKRINDAIRREGLYTRRRMKEYYKDLINNLYKIGQLNIEQRNMIIRLIDAQESKPVAMQGVTELKEAKLVKIKKPIKKKLKKYIKKQIGKQFDKIIKMIEEECKKECCECKCDKEEDEKKYVTNIPGISICHMGTSLESLENFCRDVLNIPPEFLLGPDYKSRMKEDDEKSEDKDEEKKESESEESKDQDNEKTDAEPEEKEEEPTDILNEEVDSEEHKED